MGNVRDVTNLAPVRSENKTRSRAAALSPLCLSQLTAGKYKPVGEFAGKIIIADDDSLYSLNPTSGELSEIFALEGRSVEHAQVSTDGSRMLISTSKDYLILSRSDSSDSALQCTAVSTEAVDMPYFSAEDSSPKSVDVVSRTLSHAYTDGREVRISDARVLSSDLVSAYRQIANMCIASGEFLQPCVVRYLLRDADNNVIFSSSPILVGRPQCCDAVYLNFIDTAHTSVAGYQLSATPTALKLHIPASSSGIFASYAHRLEVVASPMLQPYQPGGALDCTGAVNAPDRFAVLRLPGAAFGQFSPGAASAASLVRRLMAARDRERLLVAIDNPFDGTPDRVIEIPAPATTIENDIADLHSLIGASAHSATPAEAYIDQPHKISAGITASASGVTLAAKIKVRRFRGFSLPTLATGHSGSNPWKAVVTTIFSDGSRLSMPAEGTEKAPIHLSPVIAYPAADVVSVAIQLQVQGEPLRVMSLPMFSDPSHRFSIFVDSRLQSPQWRVADGVLTVPSDINSDLNFPSSVAVCDLGSLLCVKSVSNISSEINALLPAARSMGAWDFGRARFLCGTDAGILALTVNADRTKVAVNLLHQGVVRRQSAMVQALEGEVMAVASGALVRIKGSTVSTPLPGLGDGSLAWNAPRRELWFLPAEGGNIEAICPDFAFSGFSLASVGKGDLYSCACGALLFTDEGIMVARSLSLSESEITTCAVRWSGTLCGPWKGAIKLRLPVSASYFDGNITISHQHLPYDGAIMAKYGVCGSLHAPLMLTARVPQCDALIVTVDGEASADFCMYSPDFEDK